MLKGTRVKMLVSVGGDHVAGQSYRLRKELADEYIACGYAEGQLSREYSEEELAALRHGHQTVSL